MFSSSNSNRFSCFFSGEWPLGGVSVARDPESSKGTSGDTTSDGVRGAGALLLPFNRMGLIVG